MTSKIFKEWLTILNKQFLSENRKILLLVDNFSGHPNDTYSNIEIKYFPANCTSVLQPLDQGIIQAFKTKYRTSIVREKLDAIEYGSATPTIDLISAINKVKKAWDGISRQTIENCFRKAGFNGDIFVGEETENEFEREYVELADILQVKSNFNFDKYAYVKIDDHLPVHGMLSDSDIVATVAGSKETPISETKVDSDEEDICEIVNVPTSNEALNHLNELKKYLMSQTYDCSCFINDLYKIESSIQINKYEKQSKIDEYFIKK